LKSIEFAFLAIGAIAGAFLRYKIASGPILVGTLSVNILIINVIGSFILGVFSVLSVAWNLDSRYSLLVAIGFCGSLTTMSSFALETANMLGERQLANMAINIAANVGLSIGAVIGARALTGEIVRTPTGL